MAVRKGVASTKANLLKIKDELTFAQLGHELLDQKRNILINELLALVDQAVLLEENSDTILEQAYNSLKHASLHVGKLKAHSLSSAVNIKSMIQISQRKVMGVPLPVVDTEFKNYSPYFSPMGSGYWIDRSVEDFMEALKLMGQLAELKISITRLAHEVKKTIRKVNALEKIAIPELDETTRHIQNRLEEIERESFILMKTVKQRMEEGETHT